MSNLNIPNFPDFKTLNVNDGNVVRSIISKYPSYSDFGFTSMLCWDTEEEIELSILHDNLVVLFQDYEDSKKFFSLIGTENIDETIRTIINLSIERGFGIDLKLVPQVVVDNIISKKEFIIEENRDNFDYILSVRHHAELKGAKNDNRRYRINKFIREFGDSLVVKRLDLTNKDEQEQLIKCLAVWEKSRKKDPRTVAKEKKAINRLLNFSNLLPVKCMGFYINGRLRAFSVYEIIHDRTSCIHFEKCDLKYGGIAHYVRNAVAKELHTKNTRHINYE